MSKKKFLEEAERVAKELENASLASDGVQASDVVEQTEPQQAAEPIVNPTLVADEAQRVTPKPEGVDAGAFTVPTAVVQQANETTAETLNELSKTPEQREEERFVESQQQEVKSFADHILDIEDEINREREESKAREREYRSNAAWAGATEMAAAIANLIGVGDGKAVSQQYKSVSQDWMKKAEQDSRENRNRLQDLRQRQRETKLKMDQLRSKQALDLETYRRQKEADKANIEYRQAMTAYQNARTDAEREAAAQKAREADLKLQYLGAQIKSQESLAYQRLMQGQAAVTRANNSLKKDDKKKDEQKPSDETKGGSSFMWDPRKGANGQLSGGMQPGQSIKDIALKKDGEESDGNGSKVFGSLDDLDKVLNNSKH